MSNVAILYTGNDTVLEVSALMNQVSGALLNDADVSVTLVDAAGEEVAGVTWPLALVYLESSKGVYRVTLPHTLTIQPNARYEAQVVADGGPGLYASWTVECVARERA